MEVFLENEQQSKAIAEIVKKKRYGKQVNELAIAIIDLKNNPEEIFGINMDMFFYPASVFKIFIGAEVLRQIEIGKYTLEQKITIKPFNDLSREVQLFPDGQILKPGDNVSIDWLLESMLAMSDNTASNCLMELIGIDTISQYGITDYFLRCIAKNKECRYREKTETSVKQIAEYFALIEQEKWISPFVSKKIKEYMMKYDRATKHGYPIPNFVQYHKSGYLETKSLKSIFTKGWMFERYMHDAGIVQGKNSYYAIAIFTLSHRLNPYKYFHKSRLMRDIFEYMEKENVSLCLLEKNEKETITYEIKNEDKKVGIAQLRLVASKSEFLPEGFENNIYYEIDPEFRNKGFAKQALTLLINEAAKNNLSELIITVEEENIPSQHVVERNNGELLDRQLSKDGKMYLKYRILI